MFRAACVAGVVACALVAPSAPVGAAATSAPAPAVAVPRAETLYTSGTALMAPTDFNPLQPTAAYTGTHGLLYEPLFLYDPLGRRFIPWLAESGSWAKGSWARP